MEFKAFDSIRIGLASPEMIRDWSYGEVTRPETINYRSQKPEKDGLFCEKIFGPTKDWECHCGKYKKIRFKGMVCERCGVEVTKAKVRRERMGHIELAAPVSHIWYFKGTPSRIGQILEISQKRLEEVLYFTKYIVIDPGTTPLEKGSLLSETEYRAAVEKYDESSFRVGMGAEAIQELLREYSSDRYDMFRARLESDGRLSFTDEQKKKCEMCARRSNEERAMCAGCTKADSEEGCDDCELTALRDSDLLDIRQCDCKNCPMCEEIPEEEWKDNLEVVADDLKEELRDLSSGQKRLKLLKRLEIVEAFRLSGNKPEWMILNAIPVIPPELRPMVLLDGGRYATSDLNDLYRRVINRNNRLKRMKELEAPEIIVRNEKRMLQEAVDALIDNGRHSRPVTGPNGRAFKSLSDMLKGKQGRFRQNLLGKRVDYSGRSVIVVGPELRMYQCGLPKEMALELFKPFVMKRLADTNPNINIKSARKKVERADPEVWDALENVIQSHPVMLNRAPTLHRLGIQAFEPVLVEGRAIKLHPLVCTAFNADFDGDQMAVHVPLSAEAQAEARFLMLAANNLLKPSDGKPVAVPSQDMLLGSYYLTLLRPLDNQLDKEMENMRDEYNAVKESLDALKKKKQPTDEDLQEIAKLKAETEELSAKLVRKDGFSKNDPYIKMIDENGQLTVKVFRDVNEARMAYDAKAVTLQEPIKVRISKKAGEKQVSKLIDATVGRLIFNEIIPQNLGYVDRTISEKELDLEISFLVKKSELSSIIEKCIKIHGTTTTSEVLDKIKALGYKYSTRSGLTVAVCDAVIPPQKQAIIAEADEKVSKMYKNYNRGLISDEEKSKQFANIWNKATDDVTDALKKNLDKYNPINMMADSGARGSINQMRQLAGMRGLIANTSGSTIEMPIRANYREGLNILEYFISSRGARKGLADTALRTADSGYLTRRLVDVSQDVIIREDDCGSTSGIEVFDIKSGNAVIEPLTERLIGRYLVEDIKDAKTGEMIVSHNKLMDDKDAKKVVAILEEQGKNSIEIRSVLQCKAKHGVCAKCYGANLAHGKTVTVGEAVGIIAAQSIGEPGTQLTMRTFHTGGIANAEDITQGLPRVEELFESRRPKGAATITRIAGVCKVEEIKKINQITVTSDELDVDSDEPRKEVYTIPYGQKLKVTDGQRVSAGEPLTEGSIYPGDILAVNGIMAVQNYIITEIQKTYRSQGVDINDKHVEVIVRQMMKKVKVEDSGSSYLLPGSLVDKNEIAEINAQIQEEIDAGVEGAALVTTVPVLQGITKASSNSDSFMSAASFQETTKALTDAAIRGKTDRLSGLKENVIIGNLIPAGTGMDIYNDVEIRKSESYIDHAAQFNN